MRTTRSPTPSLSGPSPDQRSYRARDEADEVGGEDAVGGQLVAGEVAGEAVEVHGEAGSVERLEALRAESRDHAGQDVARAGLRERGIARRVDEYPLAVFCERN